MRTEQADTENIIEQARRDLMNWYALIPDLAQAEEAIRSLDQKIAELVGEYKDCPDELSLQATVDEIIDVE